jgi:CYTH domain-containing protein
MIYDLFYVSKGKIPTDDWYRFHNKFPLAQKIENVKSISDIKSQAFTKFFWVVWNDLEIIKDDIFEYIVTEWDEEYVHVFKNGDYFDGINIFPKNLKITNKEFKNRFFLEKKEIDIIASVPVKYDIFNIETYDDYRKALETSKTEMFWMTSPNLDTSDFKFDIYFPQYNEYDRYENHAFIHRVNGKDYFNGVYLLSKNKPVSKKEIEHRHLAEKKEWHVVASGPVKYDIFNIETYDDYRKALETSKTEMFWMTSPNLDTSDFKFDTYFTHNQEYERKENHSFIHRVDGKDYYNGVYLLSKHKPVTKKEIEHRFLIEKKEWDVVASGPVKYDIFNIETYNDYLKALESNRTEMFWMTSPNLDTSDFKFDMYFTHDQSYNRKENHAFIHRVDGKDYYNGVYLLSKHKPVTKKEIDHRHLAEKKEWDIIASVPVKYDIFNIETYDDYLKALETSKTEMFWMTSPNLDTSDFKFDTYFTHDQSYNRKENHSFVHKVDGKDYYNGVHLLSKHKPVTKKEIDHRYLIANKEWDIIASVPVKYDIFNIETYDDYLKALETSKTELFWMTSPNLDTSDFKFDTYFTHDQSYNRKENHAFIHRVDGKDYYNGVYLLSKHKPVTKKEIEHRHLAEKKEWHVVASGPIRYDIFNIETYDDYLKALETSKTELFWMTSPNLDTSDFKFDMYFTHDQSYNRKENHAFIHRVDGKDYYNGVYLLSKHKPVTKKEIEHRHLAEKKEWHVVASGPVKYDIFNIETYDDYRKALETSKTELFWMTSPNLDTSDFKFDMYFTHDQSYNRKENHSFVHRVDGKDYYNGVHLLSKHKPVSKKEIEHRYLIANKEWHVVASGPIRYDIFNIETYDDYLKALETSKTELFWMTSPNLDTSDFKFDMYFTHDQSYNRKENHAFIHRVDGKDYYNGVYLLSKHKPVTKKEIEHRFLIEKKEWDIIASVPVKYDIFNIETYDDYRKALETSKTELFWMTSPNLDTSDFKFDTYFTHDQSYNRKENHAFIHRVDGKDYYNGVYLLSKHKPVTKKEIEHRFLIEKKEWHVVASGPVKYDIFNIETYDDYLKALETSKTEMFWMIPFWMTLPNLDSSDFKFDIYFTHDQSYNRKENHAFIHRVDGKDYYNGVYLLSKHKPVTKKEIEHRFLIEKKEWDIVASGPIRYDIFNIETYDDYLKALETSKTEMFWMIPSEVEVLPDFSFDLYFTHDDQYDRNINHVFKNQIRSDEITFHGISLLTKNKKLSPKEVNYRYLVDKKEHDVVASRLKDQLYDMVFISYDEINADENFLRLQDIFPRLKRINGIKGIHRAHREAAKIVTSEMFWVVDADAEILDGFDFRYNVPRHEIDMVHVWSSKNPINNLVYGYGGVKLLPRILTLNMNVTSPDMTTDISKKFKLISEVSNITRFDTDPFSTWKSSFRECVKLASGTISRHNEIETKERLEIWCTQGRDKKFGEYAINGAISGKKFGEDNRSNTAELMKINNFEWLREKFHAKFPD